mgnify:CR=1 FL=1
MLMTFFARGSWSNDVKRLIVGGVSVGLAYIALFATNEQITGAEAVSSPFLAAGASQLFFAISQKVGLEGRLQDVRALVPLLPKDGAPPLDPEGRG